MSDFDYIAYNWQSGMMAQLQGVDSDMLTNFAHFRYDFNQILQDFHYNHKEIDRLSEFLDSQRNDLHDKLIKNTNHLPLVTLRFYNEFLNNDVRLLTSENDRLVNMLYYLGYPMKLAEKTLTTTSNDWRQAMNLLKSNHYHQRQIRHKKYDIGDFEVDIAVDGKDESESSNPDNILSHNDKIFDKPMQYFEFITKNNSENSKSKKDENCLRFVYPQCKGLTMDELYDRRNKVEKLLIVRYAQNCFMTLLESITESSVNQQKEFKNLLSLMDDNISQLNQNEEIAKLFDGTQLNSVTGFLGVLLRSFVDAPDSPLGQHLSQILASIVTNELTMFWDQKGDTNDVNMLKSICPITSTIYDE